MPTIDHVRYLSETIGPRGSTTPKEAEAAAYVARVLKQVGWDPNTEHFKSARSSYYPYVLFTALILVGVILFWMDQSRAAILAVILSLLCMGSVLLELSFRPNPLRWLLPTGTSQNVWTRVPAQNEATENAVLVGHLDTNRTPLIFSSDNWVRVLNILVPVCLVSSFLLMGLFLLGYFAPQDLWRMLTLPFAAVFSLTFLLMVQADFSAFAPGANDNATGAAVVLSLAERLRAKPLNHTAVWLLFSGCEEVGCYGADAFARAHKRALGRPFWISLDSVGGRDANPTYLVSETFLLTTKSDPELLQLAGQVSARLPELGVKSLAWKSTYTEGAIGAKHGFRVFTLLSFRKNGMLPEWHRPSDVIENVDEQVLARSEAFVWELLQETDRSAG